MKRDVKKRYNLVKDKIRSVNESVIAKKKSTKKYYKLKKKEVSKLFKDTYISIKKPTLSDKLRFIRKRLSVKAKEEWVFLKKISKDLLIIVYKAAKYTIKSLCVVLGFAIGLSTFIGATLTGIALGLALSPIYTIKAFVEQHNEYKIDRCNKEKLEKSRRSLINNLDNTMDFSKRTQDYIASVSNINLLDKKYVDNTSTIKLENIIQKGMSKTI